MGVCPTCGAPFGKRQRCYVCKPGKKRTGETRQCQHCGADFYVSKNRLADVARGSGKFCSRACKHAAARHPWVEGRVAGTTILPRKLWAARETRPCTACGKPVTKLVSQIHGEQWFCNRECQRPFRPQGASASKQPNPHRGQQETRPCVLCGTPVTRYLSPLTIDRPWACSKSCNMKVRSQGEILAGVWKQPKKPRRGDMHPCTVCGTEFYRGPTFMKQGRHLCSRECNAKWQGRNKVTKTCPYCGNDFQVAPSETHLIYCSRKCQLDAKIVRPIGRMHNGRPAKQDKFGYVWLWEPDHPNKSHGGWVQEHRLVAEKVLGRYLTPEEQVDHINEIKFDNDPGNLQVMTPSEHSKKTVSQNLGAVREMKASMEELLAYRERFGPLPA